ncbi:SrfA family protein [Providencia alcalifaciens]|uniref:SrfA family protein n=1 Tax=Providencia alcalifaciens TaxID=126385 RepID=UPI001CC5047A|nr:SrfA family protein [Providencia alcalifaciens]CAG9429966.1 hypothetical protein NVI2019_GHJFPKLH_03116 [Providencia alcalifaciens]
MNKAFLRSGKLENYLPLGENGQAIYVSALQLRETLRLQKKNNIADCLAIPQPNETGERIDWYSPVDGEIISWTTASEEEKNNAYALLKNNQNELKKFSENKLQSENKEQQLFGALLSKTIQFPDQDHVYIVGGQPVITFWGFVSENKQSRTDPVACLKPLVSPTPIATATAPVIEATPMIVPKKPWWRFLLWLLPLLLLLLLAAFFLRGCFSAPIMPTANLDMPQVTLPNINVPAVELPTPHSGVDPILVAPRSTQVTNTHGVNGTVVTPDLATNGQIAGAVEANQPNTPLVDPVITPLPEGDNGNIPAVSPDPNAPNTPVVDPVQSASGNTPATAISANNDAVVNTSVPLNIPQEAVQNGSVQFLNGQWNVGAGVQDQKTGKPLSLQYNMNNGKGDVIMTRSDGVTCRGPIVASMNSGGLNINNQAQANCSDGSSYRMPNITCRPGAKNIADCQGAYDKNQIFPISMKRESN